MGPKLKKKIIFKSQGRLTALKPPSFTIKFKIYSTILFKQLNFYFEEFKGFLIIKILEFLFI